MDFSKLSQNEKLAVYGSVAVILHGLNGWGYSFGLTVLAIPAAIAMLAVVLLPSFRPSTNLPGSRGSLMLLLGVVAGVILVLSLLLYIGVVLSAFDLRDLFFLIAVTGGILMAWVGWQEFQAEGGKFQLGSSAATSTDAATPAAAEPLADMAQAESTQTPADAASRADPPAVGDDDNRPIT
jgi:amino acid transporter